MKILLAPDSFKGSLSALEAAQAMAAGIRRIWPEAEIKIFPMADGGEGTLDAVLVAANGQRLRAQVSGADFKPVTAGYGLLENSHGKIAVLEAAQVVGLTMPQTRPVATRTTLGLGELFKHCLSQGVRDFMIGLGGSSTNDGGAGVLAALGVKLLDARGNCVEPTLQGLAELAAVDFSGLDARVKKARITLMSDVINPLCGERGATAVFGPQKGVADSEVALFDARLRHYAALCDAWFGRMLSQDEGAGAAGGLGYAFQLLGAQNRSGAEVVCELQQFDAALQDADWVLTGEGRSDAQTLQGKAPFVVAQHARRHGVPATLVSGGIDRASLAQLEQHFTGCFSIAPESMPVAQAMQHAAELLSDTVAQRCSETHWMKGGNFGSVSLD